MHLCVCERGQRSHACQAACSIMCQFGSNTRCHLCSHTHGVSSACRGNEASSAADATMCLCLSVCVLVCLCALVVWVQGIWTWSRSVGQLGAVRRLLPPVHHFWLGSRCLVSTQKGNYKTGAHRKAACEIVFHYF